MLKIATLGQLEIAPFSSIESRNRIKGIDWSIWLYRVGQSRVLKADCACWVGLLTLVSTGLGIYFFT